MCLTSNRGQLPSGAERSAMKQKSKYVFGAALAGVAVGGVPGLLQRADAAVVTNAAFTFESSFGGITGTGATTGPFLAESGTGSAFGVHAATTTVYSPPSG